ncbi:isocitrate lyase/PEP mutase family protein [Ningiella sp. W23]|uniref:isocitrate lyase/PEP mutase family protein n=1 Tax=Ningiella sp. W23 TaxID=3023715 RepID=UPI0037574410
MTTQFTKFQSLHNKQEPLLLNNIWDAASAAIVQANGAKALATSSASLAWSLGYADGAALPTSQLIDAIERIQRVATIPLTVDIENGYSDLPDEVADLCERLCALGVVGINIEDGMDAPELLAQKIMAMRERVGAQFYINARTDVYLRQLVDDAECFDQTLVRMKRYIKAGASGIFIPGLSDITAAKQFSDAVEVPINLMVESISSAYFDHANSGASRYSAGPNPFLAAYTVLQSQTPEQAENKRLNFENMNRLFKDGTYSILPKENVQGRSPTFK